MSSLRMFFLGQPKIERDGVLIKVPLQKALALLATLAVTSERQSRDFLSTFLWPEYDPHASFNNLRVSLHILRKAIGEEWLLIDREGIGLFQKENLWVDVHQFNDLISNLKSHNHSKTIICTECISKLSEAIQLYRGNFLEGFTLTDSIEFDDWQRFQQNALSQRALDALNKLVIFYTDQGDYHQAILFAQRWLTLDPTNESAHQALMKLYCWTNQRNAAINQYRECAQLLEKELGEKPQETTKEIYQAIKEYRLAPPLVSAKLVSITPRPITQVGSTTPFLGRVKELSEIAERLRNPACRLLTLIGPSGIGKTRLALQAALDNELVFPNGVWYIPLVAVNTPDLIATKIVEGLGISLEGQEDLQSQLLNYLKNKKALLILDNFEHILEGVSIIEGILKQAPDIKMMITSCERLNLQLEWLYLVPGLDYPTQAGGSIEEYSAVQLFLYKARQVNPNFILLENDNPYIVRICQILDGMPLGIELAASWTHLLSCQEIAKEIEQDLDFLTVSTRDLPMRHRSLKTVFERSWNLLSDEERRVIKYLSIFRGGFTRQAAEELSGANLALLSSLTNKSFLHRSLNGKYEILEISRKYIQKKLKEDPRDWESIMDRHAEYYSDYLHEREDQLKGGRQIEALREISDDIENIDMAWHWMVTRSKGREIDRSQECLHLFYNMRSWLHKGVEIFSEAVEKLRFMVANENEGKKENQLILARLLARLGYFYDRTGQYEKAEGVLQESISLFCELDKQTEMALSLRGLARLSLDLENYIQSKKLFRSSLKISEDNNDTWEMIRCLDSLGFIALYFGEYAEARQYLEKGVALSKTNGDQWGTAWCLMDLGFIALIERSYQEAEQTLQECLMITKMIGDWQGIATTLSYLALVAVGERKYEEARMIYEHEISNWQELGYQLGVACALVHYGLFLTLVEEYQNAKQYLQEALDLALNIQSAPTIERSLAGVVTLLMKEGKTEEANDLIKRTLYHPALYGKVSDVRRHLFSSADMSLKIYAQHNPSLYNEFLGGIQEINKVANAIAAQPRYQQTNMS